MTDKQNYLLILKYEDVAKECEDCKKAGLEITFYENLNDIVRRITHIDKIANVEVVGIYKPINKMVVDKNCLVTEWE